MSSRQRRKEKKEDSDLERDRDNDDTESEEEERDDPTESAKDPEEEQEEEEPGIVPPGTVDPYDQILGVEEKPHPADMLSIDDPTRWNFDATQVLLDMDPAVAQQWKLFWRMAPACMVGAIIVIIFSWLTGQISLVIAFAIIFALSGFGLLIVGLAQFYMLLFLFLVYQLAALFYVTFEMLAQMDQVYTCTEPMCMGTNKWIFLWNFLFLCGFVGFFILIVQNCVIILTSYSSL
jgi:hypothetical protein